MGWKLSKPLNGKTLSILKKYEVDKCKKCKRKFSINETAWHNKHENVYGGSKTKWYCKECYERIWI